METILLGLSVVFIAVVASAAVMEAFCRKGGSAGGLKTAASAKVRSARAKWKAGKLKGDR